MHHSELLCAVQLTLPVGPQTAPRPVVNGTVGGGITRATQDGGFGLPRISIPRTPVNKGNRKGREGSPRPFFLPLFANVAEEVFSEGHLQDTA